MLLLALTAAALAGGHFNNEPSVRLGVVIVPHAEHPVGVELGGAMRFSLIAQCGGGLVIPAPTDCYDGWAWPTVGPSALVSWRGGPLVGGFLGVVGGVGTADVHDSGFFPLWSLDARVGVSGEVHSGVALGLGLEGARALGVNVVTERGPTWTGYRTYGFLPLALRGGARTEWRPAEGFAPPRWDVAAELSPIGNDLM